MIFLMVCPTGCFGLGDDGSDKQQITKGLTCTDPSHETKITSAQGVHDDVSYGNKGDFSRFYVRKFAMLEWADLNIVNFQYSYWCR